MIRSFESARERLQIRKRGAVGSVMVEIDRSLELNQRTLDSLNHVLATAKEELDRALLRW